MGFDPNRKCIKCGQRQGYLFFCEDCKYTICNGCIVSEKSEQVFCNFCSHLSVGNRCELCGRTDGLTLAKKIQRKCQFCGSTNITYLHKKIDGLVDNYNEYVNLLRKGSFIIGDFAKDYTEIVNQARMLRREGFSLYPMIESNLIRIHNQFYEITSRATEVLERLYGQIVQNTKNLPKYQQVSVRELGKIDRTLKMIESLTSSYAKLIQDFLTDHHKALREVRSYVEKLNFYSHFYAKFCKKFRVQITEPKIALFPRVKLALPQEFIKYKGNLLLTNNTIYFGARFRLPKKARVIPLSRIRSIEIRTRFWMSRLIIYLTNNQRIKIRGNLDLLERIDFFFKILSNENEGYLVTDLQLLENLQANLDYTRLRERIETRIKDLKQIPFLGAGESGHFGRQELEPFSSEDKPIIVETKEIRRLKIKLKAAKENLRELEKAFKDRTITADIYFQRRQNTIQNIYFLEEKLRSFYKKAPRIKKGIKDSFSSSSSYR